MIIALSVLLAAFPLMVCYLARAWLRREFLQPMWVFPSLFVAGGLGGLAFGVWLSPNLEPWFASLGELLDRHLFVATVVVPVAEELGKGLVLLLFLPTRWFRSPVDGLLYGLAAGAGFATVENVLYFADAYGRGGEVDWVQAVVIRLPAALLVHGGGTAIIGGYLGAARWARAPFIVFGALPAALFVSSAIHGGWNALIELGHARQDAILIVGAVLLLIVVSCGLLTALWFSLRLEASDLRRELEPEVASGLVDAAELEALVEDRVRLSRGAKFVSRRALEVSSRASGQSGAVGSADASAGASAGVADRASRQRFEAAVVQLAFALRRARQEKRGLQALEGLRAAVTSARRAPRVAFRSAGSAPAADTAPPDDAATASDPASPVQAVAVLGSPPHMGPAAPAGSASQEARVVVRRRPAPRIAR